MNTPRQQLEQQAQEAALLPAEAQTAAPIGATSYRALYRGIKAAPMPMLRAGFAQRVLSRIADAEEAAGTEDGIVKGLGIALGVGAVYFAGAPLIDALQQVTGSIGAVPWSLLISAAGALGLAALLDRVIGQRLQAARYR